MNSAPANASAASSSARKTSPNPTSITTASAPEYANAVDAAYADLEKRKKAKKKAETEALSDPET